MKRKRDRKYLLTVGTCLMLGVFMIISLTNKKTYSYPDDGSAILTECMGIIEPNKKKCCDSVSSFSNDVVYADNEEAVNVCSDYAIHNSYGYYECQVNEKNQWILLIYNGCNN